jgi:hypothetical protein
MSLGARMQPCFDRRRPSSSGGGSRRWPAAALCLLLSWGAAPSSRAQEEILIPVGAIWKYFKGRVEPDPAWIEVDFDDSRWDAGPTGIGYGDNDDATVLTDMQNGYMSIYCRHVFELADAGSVRSLVLRIDYDDGFVAYLNGVEVARAGLTGNPPPFNAAAVDREATGIPVSFPIDLARAPLQNGSNVLAVQVHNSTIGSSDLSFIPSLVKNPDNCPQALTCLYDGAANVVRLRWTNRLLAYDSFEVRREGVLVEPFLPGGMALYDDFFPVAGEIRYSVTAINQDEPCRALECSVYVFSSSDVLIAPGDEWSFFRGRTNPPANWTAVEFDDSGWESGPTGIGYGDGDDATILADMQNNYLTVFCRTSFVISNPSAVRELRLSVVYDDGVVAYVNGAEVGRVNMPAGAVTALTPAVAAIEPSVTEFVIPADRLRPGVNIVAASVHNVNLTSSDLSFIPTLYRIPGGQVQPRFRRGDIDNDGRVILSDAIRLLNHLFLAAPVPSCADAADVDDNGILAINDAIFLLNHLFLSGPKPPPPGLECGPDPTPDPLGPCATTGC